jgi:hypothetical protein
MRGNRVRWESTEGTPPLNAARWARFDSRSLKRKRSACLSGKRGRAGEPSGFEDYIDCRLNFLGVGIPAHIVKQVAAMTARQLFHRRFYVRLKVVLSPPRFLELRDIVADG